MAIESYPLYWPDGWKRTAFVNRWDQTTFHKSLAVCRDHLLGEIDRLGGDKIILSTNIPLRNDGLPYANWKEPEDPGVAVYFDYGKKKMCFACDQYYYVRQNIRAIGKTIEALRGIERWGASDMMEKAFLGFIAITDQTKHWRDVLGLGGTVSQGDIEKRYRELAQVNHPDKGGDPALFREITVAREQALGDCVHGSM